MLTYSLVTLFVIALIATLSFFVYKNGLLAVVIFFILVGLLIALPNVIAASNSQQKKIDQKRTAAFYECMAKTNDDIHWCVKNVGTPSE